jgi:quinol monooxygenase YgiN
MRELLGGILTLALVQSAAASIQQPAQEAPVDATYYAVSYVEAAVSSRAAAAGALKQYRDASRKMDGYTSIDLFEQIGRPGHFAVVETWRDQQAFDGRDAAIAQQLLASLKPLRVSGYDQRPYKTLSVARAGAAGTAGSNDAITVVAHVDVTPSPVVPPMLRRLAEASRQEAGNLRFDVVQHMMRANHFTVVETWRDQRALDAHVAAAHTRQYRDELQPLTGSPLDERVYGSVD